MSHAIKLHVWGDFACFTRPEMKAERFTYEVMTPSAAVGILTAIYWKPEMAWVIDAIHVLKPIRLTQIRRNEVGVKMARPKAALLQGGLGDLGFAVEDERQQRAATILKNVSYLIEAHIDLVKRDDNRAVNSAAKHYEIFKRRAEKGQCFHQPYFGTREFPVCFTWVGEEDELPPSELPEEEKNISLGMMLHSVEYLPDKRGKVVSAHDGARLTARPRFFAARLQDGVLRVPSLNSTHF